MQPGMDHLTFVKMGEAVRKTHTVLTEERTMAQEIDRVIEEGVRSRLPVYIYVPTDVVGLPLDASRLEHPLDTKIKNTSLELEEDRVVQSVLELIKTSTNPAILADVLAIRYGAQDLTQRLINITHFPSYSTTMSKGVIDETSPYYNGLYNGKG
jgi:pyruvate decarboxylase